MPLGSVRNPQKLAQCMWFESVQTWGSKVSFELPAITLKDDRIKQAHSQRQGFSFSLRYRGTAHQGELIRHTHLGKMQFPSKADIFLKVHDLLRFSLEDGNSGTRSQAGPVPAQMAGLLPCSAGGSGLTEVSQSQGSPQLTLSLPQYLPILQLKILFLRRTYWFGRGLEDEAAYLCPDSPTWQKSCISCETCYHSQCSWHFSWRLLESFQCLFDTLM